MIRGDLKCVKLAVGQFCEAKEICQEKTIPMVLKVYLKGAYGYLLYFIEKD